MHSTQARRGRLSRAAVAGLCLAAGLGAGATLHDVLDEGGTPPARAAAVTGTAIATTSGGVEAIAEATLPGVVDIVVNGVSSGTAQGIDPFGGQSSEAEGSGFVLDEQGHIVTNSHVVDGASSITVRFADGTEVAATLVGSDPSSDIAVIAVDPGATDLTPLELGNADDLAIGAGVIAIGSPFGLQGSVTTGIVSALDRTIEAPNGYTISGAIQTDAAINHGNSGGPLLNASGQVIGVNAQILSDSGGNDGIGFAIPSDTVAQVANQLIDGGRVAHAYLGVSVVTVDASAAAALGLEQGAQIAAVSDGSPAAEAGLQGSGSTQPEAVAQGDVVTAIDGDVVQNADDLTAAIGEHAPGDVVTIAVLRDGRVVELEVTLGTRPA